MKRRTGMLSLAALVCLSIFAHAQEYDIVILSGRFMDPETNCDGVRNVGVKGGRIATITE